MESNKPQITFSKNAPFIVKNVEKMEDRYKEAIPTKPVMALCRCGKSENQPFCDGKHVEEGFKNEMKANTHFDRVKKYTGKDITIYFDLCICSHVAVCIRRLPSVFNLTKRPWINADGASVEEIIKTIEACPTGALKYELNGNIGEITGREAKIKVDPRGPLYIEGGIELNGDTEPPAVQEHYSLCRCDHTTNTPFCDGSHRELWRKKKNQ